MRRQRPQVKICGLTRVEEALACARAGADAIGLVFYPPSPRHVSVTAAAAIATALPADVAKVGVFVNESVATVLETARKVGLSAVQLHGQETPEMVLALKSAGITVIKALFATRTPGLDLAASFAADAVLFEQGAGPLPGGNAETWDYGLARRRTLGPPLILAGGLAPDNVIAAIAAARPDAIDLSSGVEASPGRKQVEKVNRLMAAVEACGILDGDDARITLRRVF
ncbi:MAG: phosphoribosylanthranilate isomerase [Desulfosarcinaceae bacterium]|nr:phosphoribosylanthranilate isomerase [Desulfosarcinaceae bacterium]